MSGGNEMAELCLGTAQLGMNYGINNKVGKLSVQSVYEILDAAIDGGIKIFDTASIYGEAEKLLGDYLSSNYNKTKDIRLVTKQCKEIKGLTRKQVEITIRDELAVSLKRLKRDSVDGYLLHLYRELDNMHTLRVLRKIKEEGIIKHIGVSVYDVDEAELAIDSGYIDYLQMPYSIFDQRGLTRGVFEHAKSEGITVFTRSAFLQGLLMMQLAEIPAYLQGIIPYLNKFNELIKEYDINKRHAILKFVLDESQIDYMVFGVEKREQLEEILCEKNSDSLPEAFISSIYKEFKDIPDNLILPIHWKK